MHYKLTLSQNYVQNIIGAPLYDIHIPPEHLATTEPVTNCLKETVGVENNVVYIIRDGRHWRCLFIGGFRVTECLKEGSMGLGRWSWNRRCKCLEFTWIPGVFKTEREVEHVQYKNFLWRFETMRGSSFGMGGEKRFPASVRGVCEYVRNNLLG